MRVWTNGSFARIWRTDTIYRYRDGGLRVEESVKKQKGAREDAADEVVAWSPKGARLDPALDKKRRKVIDAVALDDERVAGVISEGRSGPRLVVGAPKGPYEVDLALKGRATTKVAWAAVWPEGKAPFPSGDKPSGPASRGVRIHANAHGVAIAASESGHLFVWRHGAEDLACALRVPAKKGAVIDAVPTARGAIVTVVAGADTAAAHLADDGAVLGAWSGADGAGPPTLRLDDDKALGFDAKSGSLVLLSLPDLSELAREELGEGMVDAAAGPAGGTVVVADETGVWEVTIDDEAISIDGPYLFEEASRSDDLDDGGSSYDPVRSTGPAQVAFPAGKKLPKDPPWSVALEKPTAIKIPLRSGAGPGRGIRVAVSGAAVDDGVVRPVAVKTKGGAAVEMAPDGAAIVAVLPDVELVQGINWPLDPKPTRDDEKEAAREMLAATHFAIELVLEGLAAGSALMTIAVSAENSSSAPLRRTRPVTVA